MLIFVFGLDVGVRDAFVHHHPAKTFSTRPSVLRGGSKSLCAKGRSPSTLDEGRFKNVAGRFRGGSSCSGDPCATWPSLPARVSALRVRATALKLVPALRPPSGSSLRSGPPLVLCLIFLFCVATIIKLASSAGTHKPLRLQGRFALVVGGVGHGGEVTLRAARAIRPLDEAGHSLCAKTPPLGKLRATPRAINAVSE